MEREGLISRRERLLQLLDACLGDIPDNMISESYQARNANNYLQAIYTIERMLKEDEHGSENF